MLIGYDASRAFAADASGTENYSLELLKALAKVDRKNRYRIYLRGTLGGYGHEARNVRRLRKTLPLNKTGIVTGKRFTKSWPANFEFVRIHPSWLWTQIGLALETWRNPVDVLFVPAHTLPVLRRRIMPSSVSSRGSEGPVAILRDCFSASWRIAMTSKRRMKTVVTIHDLGVEFLPGYHQFPQKYYLDLASKYAAGTADALIAVSAATKHDLVKRYGIDAKKIQVVPEGVDTAFFRPSSKKEIQNVKIKYQIEGNYSQKSSAYILAVGTVQPRKNLEMLIEAFAKLIAGPVTSFPPVGARSKPDSDHDQKDQVELRAAENLSTGATRNQTSDNLSLVIAGKLGWDYEGILNLPKKLGIKDKVRFLGYVEKEDLPALYSGASVFAAPSLFEGFGLPILEALACGCGVVASDIAAHREIYQKVAGLKPETISEVMILVKPNDLSRWTSVLYQYISQYDKRSTLVSKKGNLRLVRHVLASNYSWEEAARQTLQVFENLLLLKLKIEDN